MTAKKPERIAPERIAPERIAKVMARAGLCSRREAEVWIAGGRVAVNGEILTTPAVKVADSDRITVDGEPIPGRAATRLWRYHKPPGLVTTHKDPQGRQTVFAKIPAALGRVISVGRLDLTSEGLLLLTNDGELARKLERPSTGWTRRYRVRVHGAVDTKKLAGLKRGARVDGISYGPIEAALDSRKGSNSWLSVSVKEGKNREIRKVMEHMGLSVTRLIRTAYGPFQLGNLRRGQTSPVAAKVLKEQVGK
jgi:23S rRNA pseudouridine2605 synthase